MTDALHELGVLAAARAVLNDAESTPAAAADAVLEILRREFELASGTGAYPGFVDTGGERRAVRFVYLGQFFLGWLSGDDGAFWHDGQWQPLDDAVREEVLALEKIAAGRAPARRVLLPVPAAVESP